MKTFSLNPLFDQGGRQRARAPPVCPGVGGSEREVSLSHGVDPGRMSRWEADQRPILRGKEVVAGAVRLGRDLNEEVMRCPS